MVQAYPPAMRTGFMHSQCDKCGWKFYGATRPDCPRCTDPDRRERIQREAARTARLKSWIAFFRIDDERGLGDTVQRLKSIAGKRAIKEDLRRIERICGCETSVAIARLNEQHPYN